LSGGVIPFAHGVFPPIGSASPSRQHPCVF
jgi:hypothetical protein